MSIHRTPTTKSEEITTNYRTSLYTVHLVQKAKNLLLTKVSIYHAPITRSKEITTKYQTDLSLLYKQKWLSALLCPQTSSANPISLDIVVMFKPAFITSSR